MSQPNDLIAESVTQTQFIGLAPFLRMSIAGIDFQPLAKEMLDQAGRYPDDAELWMNLSTAMMCLEQRELGLAIQSKALELKRCFHLAAARQPASARVLMLVMPGDLSANTPLDCLLEDADVDLGYYFVSPVGDPLAWPVPEHDVLIVGISAADESEEVLKALEHRLADWTKPVINAPRHIFSTERQAAGLLLNDVPGLLCAPAERVSRVDLEAVSLGKAMLPALLDGYDFPVILRPTGSHGGRGLEKAATPGDVRGYLTRQPESEFFVSRFIDYSGDDGLFRKCRVVLIEGEAFGCHMAVSSDWMVHYVNADMYEDAGKRREEARFLDSFADFAKRHHSALQAIYRLSKLEYIGIDCAETRDGTLFVFEIDHAMVVHAMDDEEMFPHKQLHMAKVKEAFRSMILNRARIG